MKKVDHCELKEACMRFQSNSRVFDAWLMESKMLLCHRPWPQLETLLVTMQVCNWLSITINAFKIRKNWSPLTSWQHKLSNDETGPRSCNIVQKRVEISHPQKVEYKWDSPEILCNKWGLLSSWLKWVMLFIRTLVAIQSRRWRAVAGLRACLKTHALCPAWWSIFQTFFCLHFLTTCDENPTNNWISLLFLDLSGFLIYRKSEWYLDRFMKNPESKWWRFLGLDHQILKNTSGFLITNPGSQRISMDLLLGFGLKRFWLE